MLLVQANRSREAGGPVPGPSPFCVKGLMRGGPPQFLMRTRFLFLPGRRPVWLVSALVALGFPFSCPACTVSRLAQVRRRRLARPEAGRLPENTARTRAQPLQPPNSPWVQWMGCGVAAALVSVAGLARGGAQRAAGPRLSPGVATGPLGSRSSGPRRPQLSSVFKMWS